MPLEPVTLFAQPVFSNAQVDEESRTALASGKSCSHFRRRRKMSSASLSTSTTWRSPPPAPVARKLSRSERWIRSSRPAVRARSWPVRIQRRTVRLAHVRERCCLLFRQERSRRCPSSSFLRLHDNEGRELLPNHARNDVEKDLVNQPPEELRSSVTKEAGWRNQVRCSSGRSPAPRQRRRPSFFVGKLIGPVGLPHFEQTVGLAAAKCCWQHRFNDRHIKQVLFGSSRSVSMGPLAMRHRPAPRTQTNHFASARLLSDLPATTASLAAGSR